MANYRDSEHRRISNALYRRKIRAKIIEAYGGQCKCCGEKTEQFLAVDHIDGGGKAHRKRMSNSILYLSIVREGFPKTYQILCHNCNLAKGFYGRCPHYIEDWT